LARAKEEDTGGTVTVSLDRFQTMGILFGKDLKKEWRHLCSYQIKEIEKYASCHSTFRLKNRFL